MAKKSLSRGRGPRIREDELERMAALYTEGKSFKAIGKEVGRHWQTVRKYTMKALNEREGRELRREALKGALIDHFQDLVRALESLCKMLELPGAGRNVSDGWQMPTPDRRNRLLLQALRDSHIRESPLWSWWDSWTEEGKSYDKLLSALRARVMREKENLEKSNTEASPMLTEALTEVLTKRGASIARGAQLYDPSMLQVHPAANEKGKRDLEELWLARSTQLATGYSMAELQEQVSGIMKDMTGWEEIKQLARLYRQMAETKEKMEEEVEVLSLRRAFPGRCRLCPM